MRAVARLVFTYFAGSTAARWLTSSGLVLMFASLYVVVYLANTERMQAFAIPGVITFFLGTSLMPLTFGRLSQGHAARLLPGARVKLLASAILTVLLVALPVGLLTPFAFVAGMSTDLTKLAENPILLAYTLGLGLYTYTSACIAAFWLYVLIWLVSSERNAAGFTKAMVVFLILLFVRVSADQEIDQLLRINLRQLAFIGVFFSAGYLAWPRLERWYLQVRSARSDASDVQARDFAGREIDLLLGNARPWILVTVLILPLLAAIWTGGASSAFWLYYLTISAVVAGGNAEKAPWRGRALWLRTAWPRSALFATVERSAWRHNGIVMIALLLFLFGFGSYSRLPADQLVAGAVLIVTATSLSTYLGLSLTRGVRVPEALLAAFVVSTLLGIAMAAASMRVDAWVIGLGLAVMAGLALVLRRLARRRWALIDWSQCRGDVERALRS